MARTFIRMGILLVSSLAATAYAGPLGSAFTYQGRLDFGGSPVNATADFEFTLWDADTGGGMIGSAVAVNNVTVVDGQFTVLLDFGVPAFSGDERWLEIAVASPSGGSLSMLSPRQPLTAIPYALQTRGLFVAPNGRVGIGTTSPAALLNVSGGDFSIDRGAATNATTVLNLDGARSNGASPFVTILFQNYDDDGGGTDYAAAWIRSHNAETTDSGDLRFATKGQSDSGPVRRMTIRPDGNVGIGVGTPAEKLEVDGNVVATGFIGDGSGLTNLPVSGFWSASGSDLYYNGGNIGIGTNSPTTPLMIKGNGGTTPVGITQNAVGGVATMELTTEDGAGEQASRVVIRGGSDNAAVEFHTGPAGSEQQTLEIGDLGGVSIPLVDQEIIDQSQTNWQSVLPAQNTWQSFTTGHPGQLIGITIDPVTNVGIVNFNLRIFKGEGTAGALVLSTPISLDTAASGPQFLSIPLGSAPVLLNNALYTFEFQGATPWDTYVQSGNPYAGGRRSSAANDDCYFKTHMITPMGGGLTVAGDVGIGTNNPAGVLHIVHAAAPNNLWPIRIENETRPDFIAGMRLGDTGYFYVTNKVDGGTPARLDSTGAWTIPSDRRVKNEIEPLGSVLDEALALEPVSFW
ncbi:MAG: tail fiber domain-containing protein, partial [Planctomycetales bacterium]|nr:tail fiber domain-containing protein [Planctomycetales bacterium]